MHKAEWFKYLIMGSFLVTVGLELVAVATHQYTVSDGILEHTKWPIRVAFCVWLFLHFVVEYWGVYR